MNLERLPPAAADVECSGTVHRLTWRAGQLHAGAHPDPDAERGLMALGGAPCRCIELLDAWRAHAEDPQLLVIGPRGPKITVVAPATNRSGVMYAYSPSSPETPAVDLQDLLMLRGGLARRLVATSAAALIAADADGDGPVDRRLHAALYGRLLVSLGRWLGELPELELELIDPGVEPSLAVDGSHVRAAVALEWLVDVWGADLEIVADRFTLSASPVPPNGWKLCFVDQLMSVNTCTLSYL